MMKQLFLIVAIICMSLIEAKRPMLKKNHPLYQYTSGSDKLGIPTMPKIKSKTHKKSKFNNKATGPYIQENADNSKPRNKDKTVIATEHP